MGKMVEGRHREIMDSIPEEPEFTPEELKRIEQGWTHFGDVGKVRKDLDWIKPAPPRSKEVHDNPSGK